MNQDSRSSNSASDDIDLLILIERVLIFFTRYKWIFIIAIVLGLASGFFMYQNLPKIYRSTMVVHSFVITNQENIRIIENWNNLLRKKEYEELSSTLNCPKNVLTRVKKITAEEIQKVFSVTNPNGFTVAVNVTDNVNTRRSAKSDCVRVGKHRICQRTSAIPGVQTWQS